MKFSSKQHTNRFFLKIDVTIPDHSKSNTPISVFPCNQVEIRIQLALLYLADIFSYTFCSKFNIFLGWFIYQSWENLGLAQPQGRPI